MAASAEATLGKKTRARQLAKLKNHTVILGWSEKISTLVYELYAANSNVKKAKLVLVSDLSTESMESEVPKLGNLGKIKIHYLTADVSKVENLQLVRVDQAKSVIVLADGENKDEKITKTLSALKDAGTVAAIVTELADPSIASRFESVINVDSDTVAAKVIAQGSRFDDLEEVFLDLLNFADDEIYFASIPALSGKTYADSILAFNGASVIGLLENGVTKLNPSMSSILTANTKVIAIAEDDDQIIYTGVRQDIAESKVEPRQRQQPEPAKVLVVGWSPLGKKVLRELSYFLTKGSKIHVVAQKDLVDPDEIRDLNFDNVGVSVELVSGEGNAEIEATQKNQPSEVIILNYPTMNIVEHESRIEELMSVVGPQARVVYQWPPNYALGAVLMAQLSENPQLEPVLKDLFDVEGATVNLQPISQYAELGQSVSFAELVAIARNYGESAIGYRLANVSGRPGASSIVLNPVKTREFVPATGDALIVVGNL
ncbi:MAG: hypothetical protein EBZ61_03510 [Micrococcales bacterium]|nr:hypothetical protein [Micrococcales bacterium]